jgi:hypothetical protein
MLNATVTTPMHTTPAIALGFLENNHAAIPAMAVIQAVRDGDDTPLDACSLVAALRMALHALDMVAEVEGRDAFEDLLTASEVLG